MGSDRHSVAAALNEMALLLSLKGESSFRVRAFERAARSIEARPDLEELAARGELRTVDGVGAGIAPIVADLVATGRSEALSSLRDEVPETLLDLVRVPGLGPKRASTLWLDLKVKSLDDLARVLADGSLARMQGFGAKSASTLAEGLRFTKATAGRWRLDQGLETAREAARVLSASDAGRRAGITRIETAGDVRRCQPIVTRVVLAVACERPEELLDVTFELAGPPVSLEVVKPAAFGNAWLRATGPAGHLDALARRGTQGKLEHPAASEEEIYARFGLPFIEPELREGTAEVEDAAAGTLPTLVRAEDIRGLFHVHSTYSDGRATLAEIFERAVALGHEYIGITEHSPAAAYANGLSPERVEQEAQEIAALRPRFPTLTVFHGTEADILADGSIDYGDEGLRRFDFVIASVHSSFHLPSDAQTRRLVKAVRNPRVTMLGHATGRRLLERPGLTADMSAVLAAAAGSGCIVETNASPHRLELDPPLGAEARRLGITTSIDPDAHDLPALEHTAYGVSIARKAGYGAAAVLNTRSAAEASAWLAESRARQ